MARVFRADICPQAQREGLDIKGPFENRFRAISGGRFSGFVGFFLQLRGLRSQKGFGRFPVFWSPPRKGQYLRGWQFWALNQPDRAPAGTVLGPRPTEAGALLSFQAAEVLACR